MPGEEAGIDLGHASSRASMMTVKPIAESGAAAASVVAATQAAASTAVAAMEETQALKREGKGGFR